MVVRTRFLIAALALAASAGGTGVVTAASADGLSGSLLEQLRAFGVDPSEAIVQSGRLNYVGPACPGAAWTCAPSGVPVVQVSSGGLNVFEAGGGSSHENTCVVVQSNTTGPNSASCSLNTNTNGVTQQARISQTNSSGPNNAGVNLIAVIDESITGGVSASFDQTLGQEAAVIQRNGSGANTASITEDAALRATGSTAGSGASLQDSRALAILEQDSTGGNQTADVVQNHRLISTFSSIATDVEQQQQTRTTDHNIVTFANQESGSGVNDLDLTQNQSMRAIVDDVSGVVTELQGSDSGGMIGDVQQHANTGTSHYDADIDKTMTADPDADVVVQAEDPNCCDLLGIVPSTPTTCTIDIVVTVLGPDVAQQDAFLRGRAFAQSACQVALTLTMRAGKASNVSIHEERAGQFVDVMIDCEESSCETSDPPAEPAGSAGNLHVSLRNKSDGEGFGRDPQKPYFTDADTGEVIEIKLEFHNHTSQALTNVVLRIPVPPGTTFSGCGNCLGGAPQGGIVIFPRGTVPAGGKVAGTLRVRAASPGFFSVLASFTSDQGSGDGNPLWYLIG